MTTQHNPAQPLPRPDADARDRRAWVAPLVATVLFVFLGPAALLIGGMSAMATDGCGHDDCSALITQLDVVYGILTYGGPLAVLACIAAWALPWKRRWSAARVVAAVVTVLPPLFVLLLVFTLPAP
ncbi:hypothetical protein ACH4ZX_38395 [Streptomyces sp. NPDC020490]|uniref:hypothetical protein n=1 Tax=Streptomyces sp. NPDC020490 TaxID=3365078 RepID=UPI0037AB93FB